MAAAVALFVAALASPEVGVGVGSYGALLITVGVASRRLPLMGIYRKAAKTDPFGAARANDARSSVEAKLGVTIAAGALAGLAILGVARIA